MLVNRLAFLSTIYFQRGRKKNSGESSDACPAAAAAAASAAAAGGGGGGGGGGALGGVNGRRCPCIRGDAPVKVSDCWAAAPWGGEVGETGMLLRRVRVCSGIRLAVVGDGTFCWTGLCGAAAAAARRADSSSASASLRRRDSKSAAWDIIWYVDKIILLCISLHEIFSKRDWVEILKSVDYILFSLSLLNNFQRFLFGTRLIIKLLLTGEGTIITQLDIFTCVC